MPTIDDILTMEPVFLRIMSPEIIWQIKNTEVRLTASTLSQSSFFMWKLKVSRVMPALFTSTSNPPASASAAFTAAVSSSAFDASAQNSWNFVLWSAANFSISAFASEGCEHMPHTSAPSAKNVSAIFLPIPRDEPVTIAFLFSNNILSPYLLQRIQSVSSVHRSRNMRFTVRRIAPQTAQHFTRPHFKDSPFIS